MSDWAAVLCSVLQGSVLGTILFNIFIDDIDEAAKGAFISKFADDTKAAMVVENDDDASRMQECIDSLCRWATKWKMVFNTGKCKIMHLGIHNKEYDYTMNGEKITKVTEEKDLGVWTTQTLKPTKQCETAALQANLILRSIAKSFHYRRTAVLVPLFKTFVRPKLEYAVAAWSPRSV